MLSCICHVSWSFDSLNFYHNRTVYKMVNLLRFLIQSSPLFSLFVLWLCCITINKIFVYYWPLPATLFLLPSLNPISFSPSCVKPPNKHNIKAYVASLDICKYTCNFSYFHGMKQIIVKWNEIYFCTLKGNSLRT